MVYQPEYVSRKVVQGEEVAVLDWQAMVSSLVALYWMTQAD